MPAGAVTATGGVTHQHKLKLSLLPIDESYLAASLKVPPPKKKIVRSEDASQRLIRERQREGVTLPRRLRPRPQSQACSRVRFRLFFKLALFGILIVFCFCVTGGRKVRFSALLG
jgi:hypothetical protein